MTVLKKKKKSYETSEFLVTCLIGFLGFRIFFSTMSQGILDTRFVKRNLFVDARYRPLRAALGDLRCFIRSKMSLIYEIQKL